MFNIGNFESIFCIQIATANYPIDSPVGGVYSISHFGPSNEIVVIHFAYKSHFGLVIALELDSRCSEKILGYQIGACSMLY